MPNLERNLTIQFHEAHTFPNKCSLNRSLQDLYNNNLYQKLQDKRILK